MSNVTTKKVVAEVLTTKDHKLFKRLEGNREVNKVHLKRLKESMLKKLLLSPILVNEKMEVIDGQHRLEAATELGLPVNYIVKRGYGLEEVQILNANSRNWTPDDYLDGYIEMGLEDYSLLKQFREEFGFKHGESLAMLLGVTSTGPDHVDMYRNGDFEIKDWKAAVQSAEKILMVAPYYKGIRRRAFVTAMLTCFKNPAYNHAVFVGKLRYLSTRLVDCTNVEAYLTLIEEIYNHRNTQKINIRFFNHKQ